MAPPPITDPRGGWYNDAAMHNLLGEVADLALGATTLHRYTVTDLYSNAAGGPVRP